MKMESEKEKKKDGRIFFLLHQLNYTYYKVYII
jgi:hypothetical protein